MAVVGRQSRANRVRRAVLTRIRGASRGRPLEQLFGSAGVRQVWAQVCRLLVPMPEALLEGCADTSPATVPLGTIR